MKNLQFYVSNPELKVNKFPYFLLVHVNWDDFGRQTSFTLYYCELEKEKQRIGSLKIIHLEKSHTGSVIPKSFTKLPDEFCSLGQDIDFYKELSKIGNLKIKDVLDCLNDVAFNPGIIDSFQNTSNYKNSLIRYSEAEKALRQAKFIIEEVNFDRRFKFSYRCLLPNAAQHHEVEFNFGDKNELPNNIIAIIGKNGTGKTKFLAQLALDISGHSRKLLDKETFTPSRPLFSKIIAVSYSIFDKFSRPEKDRSFSYHYCGIKSKDGRLLSEEKIIENNKEALKIISDFDRKNLWYNSLKSLLGEENAERYWSEIFDINNFDFLKSDEYDKLSSGHKYLMYVITQLIANIREDSLLLIDEPEIHLHPNAIVKFVNTLRRILQKTESYAVIATHSPYILQAIPARYVRVFEREGNYPIVRQLSMESFGANIDKISEEVFATLEVESIYKSTLNELSKTKSYDDILKIFDKKLSLNPLTYLLSLDNEENTDSKY